MRKAAIHKSSNGNWTLCGRFAKRIKSTAVDDEVTCKVCLAGGMSNFKLKHKNMSVHNHDEELMKSLKRPGLIGDVAKSNDAFAENNRQKWDKILTDAIELTEGQIQPYDRILKYLSTHYKIVKEEQ